MKELPVTLEIRFKAKFDKFIIEKRNHQKESNTEKNLFFFVMVFYYTVSVW